MKQLILFFCLVALVPLGISAQEDHAQPLKKRVRTLSYSVTCKMEKDINVQPITIFL